MAKTPAQESTLLVTGLTIKVLTHMLDTPRSEFYGGGVDEAVGSSSAGKVLDRLVEGGVCVSYWEEPGTTGKPPRKLFKFSRTGEATARRVTGIKRPTKAAEPVAEPTPAPRKRAPRKAAPAAVVEAEPAKSTPRKRGTSTTPAARKKAAPAAAEAEPAPRKRAARKAVSARA